MFAIRKRTDSNEKIMDARSTTCIKGILCLHVMLHNLGLDYKGNSEIMEIVCEHTGGIGVGVFFFLSAFGIIRSYQAKGNKYLLKLIFVHIVKLYIISVLVNLVTYLVFFQGSFEKTDLLLRIFNLDVFNDFNRMNRHGWYIPTIIGMYLIFAIVFYLFSFLKTEKKFIIAGIVLAVIATGFRIGAQIADKGGMYTREMPCFSIGCLYAVFYDKFNELAKKYFTLAFWLLFVAFWIGFFTFEPIGAYAICLMLIVVSQKITYYHPISFFLGKICLGVYLFLHFSSLIMQPFITNQYWWVLTNTGLIFELTLALYAVEYGLQVAIRKTVKFFKQKKHPLEPANSEENA
jgi:peptidoglycan/LPS O-acetylase OafA/YrhL